MRRDDEDEAAADAPVRLFTPLYWAAIGIGLALTLAGGALGLFGARHLGRASPDRPAAALTGAAPHGRGAGPPFPTP